MAHLEISTVLREAGLVLSKEEAKILLPAIKHALNVEDAHIGRYQDILEGGEATDRQQTLLVKHQEKRETLRTIYMEATHLACKK